MNINRGITNITITTKRRDALYKRTQSDETNENCIPATYGVPIPRCCGSVPIKIPASKTTLKVTRPTLLGQELMSSAGGMTHLRQLQGLVVCECLYLAGYLKRELVLFCSEVFVSSVLIVNSDALLLTLRPAGGFAVYCFS
jgi:hypothetical protein